MELHGGVLRRSFYVRDTVTVARELLGKYIVHRTRSGLLIAEITETEAYDGVGDKACHAYGGRRTDRNQVMYQIGGVAYVYLIYGIYNMLNVVTGEKGDPCAVLIRGAFPLLGFDAISGFRFGKDFDKLSRARQRALLNGPGKVCVGLGIGRTHNGADLTKEPLLLTEPLFHQPFHTQVGKRINIDYAEEAVDFPYRFVLCR